MAKDPTWLKLLRYRPALFKASGYESEVDDPTYFLHPQGKTHPDLELAATLEAFQTPIGADVNLHAQCRFPARKKWLLKTLGENAPTLPTVTCTEYDKFKELYETEKIAVVFSAYFLGNPGSSFGHSLMKFSLKSNRSQSELLDYGLNSGAVATTENPLLYALFGLAGLFKGDYSFFPYYYKIREYNNYESRDLWSYDLDLNAEERSFLLDHVWEIGKSYYDYYFFFENCSYQMLTIMDFKFKENSPVDALHFYVIPTDTLRALMKVPDLVTKVSFRPSTKTAFEEAYRELEKKKVSAGTLPLFERLILQENIQDLELVKNLETKVEQALLIDTVVAYIDFKHAHALLEKNGPVTEWRRTFLRARSELTVPPLTLAYEEQKKHPPHHGHKSTRLTLWSGYSTLNQMFLMPEIKFAFHDLLDSTLGHPKEAQVDFMKIRGRFNQDSGPGRKKIKLDELSILEVSAMNPWNRHYPMASWQVRLGQKLLRNKNCMDCQSYSIDTSYGVTKSFLKHDLINLSFFGDSSVGVTEEIQNQHYRLAVGPKVMARFHLSDRFKLILSGLYHYEVGMNFPHYYQNTLAARYSFTDSLALSLDSQWRPRDQQVALGLNYYLGP